MNRQPIGLLLKQITDKIKASADASLKNRDLTLSQVRILQFITHRDGKVTQKSIEDHLQVSHPTVVGLVSRMEKNGYLVCYFDDDDKRNKLVCLTEKARHISQEMEAEIAAQERKLIEGLSEENLNILYQSLCKIYDNIL